MIKLSKICQKIYEVNLFFINSNNYHKNIPYQIVKINKLSAIKSKRRMISVKNKLIKYLKLTMKQHRKQKAK
jgi:hypothetical protein